MGHKSAPTARWRLRVEVKVAERMHCHYAFCSEEPRQCCTARRTLLGPFRSHGKEKGARTCSAGRLPRNLCQAAQPRHARAVDKVEAKAAECAALQALREQAGRRRNWRSLWSARHSRAFRGKARWHGQNKRLCQWSCRASRILSEARPTVVPPSGTLSPWSVNVARLPPEIRPSVQKSNVPPLATSG